MMNILTNKLRIHQLEDYRPMADEQEGFRKDRSTIQQLLMVRLIVEKQRGKTERFTTALSTSKRRISRKTENLMGNT